MHCRSAYYPGFLAVLVVMAINNGRPRRYWVGLLFTSSVRFVNKHKGMEFLAMNTLDFSLANIELSLPTTNKTAALRTLRRLFRFTSSHLSH